jgi:hypothetical protein
MAGSIKSLIDEVQLGSTSLFGDELLTALSSEGVEGLRGSDNDDDDDDDLDDIRLESKLHKQSERGITAPLEKITFPHRHDFPSLSSPLSLAPSLAQRHVPHLA